MKFAETQVILSFNHALRVRGCLERISKHHLGGEVGITSVRHGDTWEIGVLKLGRRGTQRSAGLLF